jgi:hypothetical protein
MGACGRLHRWSGHPNGGPTQAIAPRDGHIAIAVPTMRPARACRSGETCRGCHGAVRTLCHVGMSALSPCRHGLPVRAVPPPPAEHVTGCCRGGRLPTRAGGHQAGWSIGMEPAFCRSSIRAPPPGATPSCRTGAAETWFPRLAPCSQDRPSRAGPSPGWGRWPPGRQPLCTRQPGPGSAADGCSAAEPGDHGRTLGLFADGAWAFSLDAAWPKGSVTTDATGTLVRS